MSGTDYEFYLHNELGFGQSFNHRGREFDGFIGDATHLEAPIWYEAKSASVWTGTDLEWINKLKSDIGSERRIAEQAGKEFRLLCGGPIQEDLKLCLEDKGIRFVEILD